MRKRKKQNKLKAFIIIFLIVVAIAISAFGRFIYNSAREAYLASRQFYFTSDILTVNGAEYEYNNWGGADVYPIEFELYSYNNELSKIDYDLNYTVTCESLSPTKIECSIGSENGPTTADGTIYVSQNNTSKVTVYVKPIATITKGETVKFRITASTQEPYAKELSCEISLNITLGNTSYSIEDVQNRDYALLKLVNGNDTAVSIKLSFDPNILRLDLNDEIYPEMTATRHVTINGKQYISEVEFTLTKETAKNIKFYKVDKSQNYTYPSGDTTSAIVVNI